MSSTAKLTYVGHATVLIELDGVRLMTDPLLRNRVGAIRRQAAPVERELTGALDAVLISHLHLDHLDRPSLRRLDRNLHLIAPAGTTDVLRDEGFHNIEEIRISSSTRVGNVKITAVYAHHSGTRHPFGAAADCLGYLIRGSSTVYFAGDTDLFPGMAGMSEDLDLALLPVWGWGPTLGEGHLNPRKAAESLQLLKPHMAVPIHWGTFCPIGMGWYRPRFLSEPPYAFKGHATHLAPSVDVRVVHPGNFVHFGR